MTALPYPRCLSAAPVHALLALAVSLSMTGCGNEQAAVSRAIDDCRREVRFDARQRTALASTKAFVACVDAKAGPDGRRLFAERRKVFDALPNHPCEYVGIWSATRGEAHYRVVLDEDGSFHGEAYSDTRPAQSGMTGSWGVSGNRLVWMYDTGLTWPPDANPITALGKDAFELTEVDGSVTRYDLLDRTPFERCGPQTQ